jgi:dissimilatory sulfite reductase (desulfoviridin) alpha/beta subunit
MEWKEEALKIVEEIPLPPMIAQYAKMDAERRAEKKGLDCVTVEVARETETGYEQALGKEAVDILRAMARGEDVQLPDEFFVEEPEELYNIELCPAKFGASTLEKREQMRQLLTPMRNKLKELGITQIIKDKAQTSLMSHHAFRISVTGCPNACFSPYFSDFGAIGVFRPAVKDNGCIQCEKCVEYCSERAITLEEKGPVIDYQKCVLCSGCVEECEEGVIFTEKKGYKVVAGGTGARRPHIAKTVSEFTDLEGVLKILEKAINMMKDTPVDGRVIEFHDVVEKHGIEKFRI